MKSCDFSRNIEITDIIEVNTYTSLVSFSKSDYSSNGEEEEEGGRVSSVAAVT